MQHDPLGYYDGLNLYEYCENDPVNWVDPWGEQGVSPDINYGNNPADYIPPTVVAPITNTLFAVAQKIQQLEERIAGIEEGDLAWGEYVLIGYNKYTSLPNMGWKWNSAYQSLQDFLEKLRKWWRKLKNMLPGGGKPPGGGVDDPNKKKPYETPEIREYERNRENKAPHRKEFIDKKTGEKISFDKGQPKKPGWRGKDHMHNSRHPKGYGHHIPTGNLPF